MTQPLAIDLIAAARPNFMKIAPLYHALKAQTCGRPLVFPVHPRTRQRLQDFGLAARLEACAAIHMTEPLSYIDFMSLAVDR